MIVRAAIAAIAPSTPPVGANYPMGRSAVDPISKNENEFRQHYRNSRMIYSRCRHFSKPRQSSEPRLLDVALDLTLATSWKSRPSSVKSSSPTVVQYAFRIFYQERYEAKIKFSFRKISYQEWRNLSWRYLDTKMNTNAT